MYNFIYHIYNLKFSNSFLENWIPRITVRIMNIFIPIYFRLTRHKKTNRLLNRNEDPLLIVSLTTFPVRIDKVWLTIESIIRQSQKPDKIFLWLYKGEFNGKNSLPKELLNQEKRGLEIRFCDVNLRPHKKYPRAILCPISRKIFINNEKISSYYKWKYLKNNSTPSFLNLTMGGGGTLYPPKSMHNDIFDKNKIIKLALNTDDLWLKIMSLRKNTKVVSLAGEYSRFFIPIIIKRNIKLMDNNIDEGHNDIAFKTLIDEYSIPVSAFKD